MIYAMEAEKNHHYIELLQYIYPMSPMMTGSVRRSAYHPYPVICTIMISRKIKEYKHEQGVE